jgi:hypothetical protein
VVTVALVVSQVASEMLVPHLVVEDNNKVEEGVEVVEEHPKDLASFSNKYEHIS